MKSETTAALLTRIEKGSLHPYYNELYGSLYTPENQDRRYLSLVHRHIDLFGISQDTRIYSTSGRTELGGNHTDHNHGHVLAASINLDTIAAVSSSDDMRVVLDSEGFDPVVIDISDLERKDTEEGRTEAIVRGIAERFTSMGCSIRGFRANTSTKVLKGSGLSSSAAIEVLIGTIFNDLYHENLCSTIDLALFGKYAENVYFGKPSGLMDQLACAYGGIIGIDFHHAEHPQVTPLSYDFHAQDYTLVVVDTGGNHTNLTPEYAAIPYEMQAVAAYLGKSNCRELTIEEFLEAIPVLRKALGDRAVLRTYHFLQENLRAMNMVTRLQDNDFTAYISLVKQSGASSAQYLQNLYAASCPAEQGIPVALARTELFLEGRGACRVHGGGFAGTIQAYIPTDYIGVYTQEMEKIFGEGSVTPLAIRKRPTGRII